MATTTVPMFYSFFFKNLDPLIALYGVYLNFFDPSGAVTSMAPKSVYDPNQVFLFHQSAGLALAVAFISAALPRYTNDVGVWKIFQFGLLLSDFAGLSGVYNAMARQGRLSPETWTDDDKACGGTYVVLTLIRLMFVLGIGLRKAAAVSNKKRA
ncbi:hypothetical protein BC832DRAFT_592272 [Gaertneriomyces semiglobifer]|nr:hypothetical protein BC832DRAFT_592272 [Gaertneriomyces semiglobifer]